MLMDARNHRMVLSLISLLIIFLISVLGWCFLKSSYQIFVIYTPDTVSGLLTNALVEFKGVEVGVVNRIELIDHDWVKIELHIQKNFHVTKNTAALISTRGLTNRGYTWYVFIELLDTKIHERSLPPSVAGRDPVIPLLPSNSYSVDKT